MSERMSQSEIDALIAQMTSAETETAAGSFAPAPPAQTPPDSATSLSQTEIDALFSSVAGPAPAPQPEPVAADLGPISQAEVDSLLTAAAVKREAITAEAHGRMPRPSPPPAPPVLPGGVTSLLMEISLDLIVELGRSRMPLKQVLGLAPGSVITLENHFAADPVRVLINQTPVMKAEVVVIGENYGIRITESRLTQKAS